LIEVNEGFLDPEKLICRPRDRTDPALDPENQDLDVTVKLVPEDGVTSASQN